ncbi:hypothetical protein F4679DRAFT_547956 [Xylaria curta]|nr:hypothetical protein F4679DRAFT_547956 [Xylaria curta]
MFLFSLCFAFWGGIFRCRRQVVGAAWTKKPKEKPVNAGAAWTKRPKKKPVPTLEDYMMMESKRRDGVDTNYKQKMEKYRGDDAMLQRIEREHDVELKRRVEWDQEQKLRLRA